MCGRSMVRSALDSNQVVQQTSVETRRIPSPEPMECLSSMSPMQQKDRICRAFQGQLGNREVECFAKG